MADTVLVTGASGFVAQACMIELLRQGYAVRGTLRSPRREAEVRAVIEVAVPQAKSSLSFAFADLTQDDGWDDAMAGCRYMLHVASPFPLGEPGDENEIIRPAVDGALRALQAAAGAGVKRTVMTSSLVAVMYGHDRARSQPYDEHDWSHLADAGISAYTKSKTLAEKAAWDFVAGPRAGGMELTTINPGLVLGPIDNPDTSTSVEIVRQLMSGAMPVLPRLNFPVVDVRDVASAHVAALTVPEAAGERFCCAADSLWVRDIAAILRGRLSHRGVRISKIEAPDFATRLVARFRDDLKPLVPDLGLERQINTMKIRRVLGWSHRTAEEAVIATAESLLAKDIIKAAL